MSRGRNSRGAADIDQVSRGKSLKFAGKIFRGNGNPKQKEDPFQKK